MWHRTRCTGRRQTQEELPCLRPSLNNWTYSPSWRRRRSDSVTTWWSDLHYGAWLGHWYRAEGELFPSQDSLTKLDQTIRQRVLETTEAWMSGEQEHPPTGQPPAMWVIAAELGPLQDQVAGRLTSRPLAPSEAALLAAQSWQDRPALTDLRSIGEDLTEVTEDPQVAMAWRPLGWLPSELAVIAEAAGMTIASLYDL